MSYAISSGTSVSLQITLANTTSTWSRNSISGSCLLKGQPVPPADERDFFEHGSLDAEDFESYHIKHITKFSIQTLTPCVHKFIRSLISHYTHFNTIYNLFQKSSLFIFAITLPTVNQLKQYLAET